MLVPLKTSEACMHLTHFHQLLTSWQQKVQGWAKNGQLLDAAIKALKLSKIQPPNGLNKLAENLSEGIITDLPKIELLEEASIQNCIGAYSSATSTIYLNAGWLKTATKQAVASALTEEFGHHLDAIFNKKDTQGDEGKHFAHLLTSDGTQAPENSLFSINDHGWIKVNGLLIEAEFKKFTGTNNDDNFNGTGFSDKMYGYGGNDFLKGGGDIDYIYGGGGSDKIYAKWTGEIDTVSNYLFGGEGDDKIYGGHNKDILRGDGDQTGQETSTNEGNDILKGYGGADLLTGGNGHDQLNGGSGYDKLDGGQGADC